MHAGTGKLITFESRTLPYETWIVVVDRRAGSYAVVAPSATVQINDHRLPAIHQAIVQDEFQ